MVTRMARRFAPILFALLLLGCDQLTNAPGPSGDLPTRTAKADGFDRIHQQAHDALERWAEAAKRNGGASITFAGPLTSQIGEWESEVAENNKLALAAGHVVAGDDLSRESPGRRKVMWVDEERTVESEVLSAAAAFEQLTADVESTECEGCRPIVVTEANLATSLVETKGGPAEVPTWVFSVEGSGVRITRVAVDKAVTIDPPAWNAEDPPEGISIDLAIGRPRDSKIRVRFIGAVDGFDEPCGARYTAETVESELCYDI